VVDTDDLPDMFGLRRRVLLTGIVALLLFFTAAYVLTAVRASSLWLVPVLVLLHVLVTRPMLRPVREMTRLRRRLAYQAFLEQRGGQDGQP